MPTTRQMSDRHEAHLAEVLGGWVTPGSGSTFAAQLDVHTPGDRRFHWRADGKSTLGNAISVTRKMLDKLVEQAHGARPLLPLRWYRDERLTGAEDWVLLRLDDFSELDEVARGAERVALLAEAVRSYTVSYDADYEPDLSGFARDVLSLLRGGDVTTSAWANVWPEHHPSRPAQQELLDRLRELR